MKYAPFFEIIDFKSERKEYVKLCKNKSKKYRFYSDWENHIAECLLKFNKKEDLHNFKHYCINRKRTTSKAPEMFSAYVILFISICFSLCFSNIPKEITIWLLPIILALIIIYSIIQHKKVIYESYLFEDIIKIIEKIENIKKNGGVDIWDINF